MDATFVNWWLNERAVWRELLSLNVFTSFPFVCEGGIWGLIILVLDHCLRFYYITTFEEQ